MSIGLENDEKTYGGGNSLSAVVKRGFDIVFAVLALLAFSPIILVIYVIHKCVNRGPVFFSHERIGADGKAFQCLKFRTMVADAEQRLQALLDSDPAAREEFERDSKLKNDPRIIPVIGNFLRSSSLDEIPQFVNVLMGDMAVVGPRPVTHREFLMYGDAMSAYASVRPGITGLWQVSGRNRTTFEERVTIDKRYVANWSILGDMKIVYKTVAVVLTRDGAY